MHSVGSLINDGIKFINAWRSKMLNYFRFGKLLEQGIDCYNQENYQKAQAILAQALELKPDDFTANFWYARTAAIVGDYQLAEQHLQECKKLKPQIEGELLSPWMELAVERKNDTPDLSGLNQNTNNILDFYQHKRIYSTEEFVVSIVGSFAGLSFYYFLIRYVLKEVATSVAGTIFLLNSLCWFILVLVYYIKKPVISIHLRIQLKDTIKRAKSLIFSKPFLGFCIFELLVAIYFIHKALHDINFYDRVARELVSIEHLGKYGFSNAPVIFQLGIIETVTINVLFRGFIYGFLRQYHVAIAIVAGIFLSDILTGYGFFWSTLLIYFVERYKSITAPIIIDEIRNIWGYLWMLLIYKICKPL